MGTSTRKRREVRQRELLLLDVARRMLIEQGYAGLNMDRLAEATEYSKGTVYLHFSTKEDLVAALALQTLEHRAELFGKALAFPGRSRERFLAVGMADELFFRLHPHHFRSELVFKMADLQERAKAERLVALEGMECQVLDDVMGLIREAVDGGDLVLPAGVSVGDVLFSLFSMAVGTHTAIVHFPTVLEKMGLTSPHDSLRKGNQTYLDGLGWRPLSNDWDYENTFRRLEREVFADEWRRAGAG